MYGVFGGYTRWAVVFLIIFVLFFLLVPGYLGGYAAGPAMGVASYHAPMAGGYNMMSTTTVGTYGYESPSSL